MIRIGDVNRGSGLRVVEVPDRLVGMYWRSPSEGYPWWRMQIMDWRNGSSVVFGGGYPTRADARRDLFRLLRKVTLTAYSLPVV